MIDSHNPEKPKAAIIPATREGGSILVVDDDDLTRKVLRLRLERHGYTVTEAASGERAIELALAGAFDLVLLDVVRPEADGREVLRQLRERFQPTELPIIMLTMREGSDEVVQSLLRGANDYVSKAMDFTVILARMRTQLMLVRLMKEVHRLAVRDPLTDLYNRRGFLELGRRELERVRRYGGELHAIVADLDDFKRTNDAYGHRVGDQVLELTAERCREAFRVTDLIGRWGGEEFAVLLAEIDGQGAHRCAERLVAAVGGGPFATDAGEVRTTITAGLASLADGAESLGDLLDRADRAMYAGKRAGKNRVATEGE